MKQDTELLSKLVKIKSYSEKEVDVANFISSWLSSNKIKVLREDNNIIVCIKGSSLEKAIIFDGHMDTVNVGIADNWKTNPFDLTEIDGKLYGLGASDMKGGVAAMMLLAKKLVANKPPCDVWFAFVVKEELDGSGSANFIKWFTQNTNYKEVSAVIGDTTGINNVEIGHKGNAFIKVKFVGQSGHGSRSKTIKPQAIIEANNFICKLNTVTDKWDTKYGDEHLGLPSVAVTGISSGDLSSPNKIPSECIVQLDIRTTPKLHKNLKTELDKWELNYDFVTDPAPFGWCDPKEKIVKVLKIVTPTANLTYSAGATDQCFFTKANIPAVIFGPGEKSVVHQEDEWIEAGEVDKFVQKYFEIINLWGSNL